MRSINPIQQLLIPVLSVLVILSAGCKKNPVSPDLPPQVDIGAWGTYTPFVWTHDGQPYDSVYCTVYSDEASFEMKQQVGMLADEKFNRILGLFHSVNQADFRYPPGNSKIEVYINRNHAENIAWAYWGGFIITIRSSDLDAQWYPYAAYTTAHELTHVFEFLIEGREWLGTEVWFKEGIAVYVGGVENIGMGKIDTLNELESWILQSQNVPGQGNPVAIHQDSDYPPGANTTQYYVLFELAVRYLLDAGGLGKSYNHVLSLFYDLRNGVSFPDSFQQHFGIGVSDYENEFYERMRTYLNE